MRIGELAARTGLSVDRIRAWERRYHLLAPSRSSGGYRLYTEDDLRTLLAMRDLVSAGVPASEAARRLLTEEKRPRSDSSQTLTQSLLRRLRNATDCWDEAAMQTTLDEAFATFDFETLVGRLFVPFLVELGERWSSGDITVAHEHFASSLLRGRLLAFARGWDRGFGPRLILACVPGELHDLPLVMFGILARRRGWRITFLGADTPLATVRTAHASFGLAAVVFASTTEESFLLHARELRTLFDRSYAALGGEGATETVGRVTNLPILPRSLIDAADALTDVFAAVVSPR